MNNVYEVTMRTCMHHNDNERVAARMYEHGPGCPVCAMNKAKSVTPAEPDSGIQEQSELLQACDRPDLYEKLKGKDAPTDHVEHV